TAVAHSTNALVTGILTKGALDQIRADDLTSPAFASRMASALAGRACLPSDGYEMSYDSGSGWTAFGPLFPLTEPASGNFSWVNQGSSTLTQQGSGLFLQTPGSASYSLAAQVMNVPAKPYNIDVMMQPNLYLGGTCYTGLCWYDGTKFVTFGYQWDG